MPNIGGGALGDGGALFAYGGESESGRERPIVSKPNPRNANGSRYRKGRAALRARGEPCWICRAFGRAGDIDYSLPARHPYSFELDHLVPISKGGDPYDPRNQAATHRCCNEWRSNKSVEEVLAIARGDAAAPRPPRASSVQGNVSREW